MILVVTLPFTKDASSEHLIISKVSTMLGDWRRHVPAPPLSRESPFFFTLPPTGDLRFITSTLNLGSSNLREVVVRRHLS